MGLQNLMIETSVYSSVVLEIDQIILFVLVSLYLIVNEFKQQ